MSAFHVEHIAALALAGLTAAAAAAALTGAPPAAHGAVAGEIRDADGLVYRYYASYGYRFQPLLSFSALNAAVSAHKAAWSRYSLGGGAADLHYHEYHLELLRRLAATHPHDRVWRTTYLRWSCCPP